MVGSKPFTVELKEHLLEYLIDQAEDWDGDSPDIRIFWHTIERDFHDAKGTTWHGKDFEQKMEREEETWLEECEDVERKRRRGHEKDSNYDRLMAKWCVIWNKMLQKHWQYMVDTGEEKFELVPEEFKENIKIPKPHYEYDGAKLERVVQAAMERAREAGKHDLAAAVEQVYLDALQETKLRILLEAILTQRADRQQNEEFQAYVKLAKAKIREQKEQKLRQDGMKAVAAPVVANGGAPAAASVAAPVAAPIPAPVSAPLTAPVVRAPPVLNQTIPYPAEQAPVQVPAPHQPAVQAPTPTQLPAKVLTPVIVPTESSMNAAAAPSTLPTTVSPSRPTSTPKASKTTPKTKAASKTKLPGNPMITPTVKVKPQIQGSLQTDGNTTAPAQPSSSVPVRQNIITNPRVTAILGDLQFAETAQQILTAAPDIDDSRLQALKSTLINHPETKTNFVALVTRLEKETLAISEDQAVAGAPRPTRVNAGKRRRTSTGGSSMAAAEEDDLLEAQRAAKRRRGEMGEDDGGDYHPLKAVRDKTRKKKKSGARPSHSQSGENSLSRDSSPLSDLSEMDIESTKSAYVDELVRRRTVEQARNDIVERYGPVSPTDAGDGDDLDWASMASPTLGPTQLDDGQVQLTERVPSPPPEPAPPAENDALRLISGATAQAVAKDPGIGRLEAKLDTLITASSSTSRGQTAHEMNVTNTETLKEIAKVLTTADLQNTRPEFVRLVLQLTTNAAEAAIHSAEAAKKAGEMARDVGMILQQLGMKGGGGGGVAVAVAVAGGDHPATPVSENN